MSSLSYSTYQSADETHPPAGKKRIPTIGKPKIEDTNSLETTGQPILHDAADKETRLTKMNQLILQNTLTAAGNDERMGDFIPLPQLSKAPQESKTTAEQEFPRYTPISPFPESDSNNNYSSYQYVYTPPKHLLPFNGTNAATTTSNREMDKIWERLNYMTILLEEQRTEKTNFITEEFVLYMLLGVFIIYVVDGFSRSGKYVR